MNIKTKQLAALISHAAEKKALVAVTSSELLSALQDMENALETISFSYPSARAVKEYLYQALHTLSGLLFMLKNKPLANLSGNHKCVITRAEILHGKIMQMLKWYCNVAATHQHNLLPVKALLKQLAGFSSNIKEEGSVYEVFALLQPGITELQQTKTLPCHRWVWWSECCAAVANAGHVNSVLIENMLIGLNFNTPEFISWLAGRLEQAVEMESTVAQKLEYITTQLLKYELLPAPAQGYLPAERSVKHTMITILKTKLLLFNSLPGAEAAISKMQWSKLNTVLSVPQLALLIRLLVDAKLISENNIAGLLKNVAGIVSTSKTASISSESLRVNYYTPNNAAKNIVKDYLISMINLLRTY